MRRARPEPLLRPRVDQLDAGPTPEWFDARDLLTPELHHALDLHVGMSPDEARDRLRSLGDPSFFLESYELNWQLRGRRDGLDVVSVEGSLFPDLRRAASGVWHIPNQFGRFLQSWMVLFPNHTRGLVQGGDFQNAHRAAKNQWESEDYGWDGRVGALHVMQLLEPVVHKPVPEYDTALFDEQWDQVRRRPDAVGNLLRPLIQLDPRGPAHYRELVPELLAYLDTIIDDSTYSYSAISVIATIDAIQAEEYRVTAEGLVIQRGPVTESPNPIPNRDAI